MKQLRAGQTAFFASDLHLSADTPHTLKAFESWLASVADQRSLIYLIGDLFEAWCGDDFSDSTTQRFARACQSARACGADMFLMHGNRDFLMGEAFAELCNAELLSDPEFLQVGKQVCLITHGDALCTDDKAYQQFRAQSRSEEWQQRFLALPLDHRLGIARQMRTESQSHKANMSSEIMDVNPDAVSACLRGQWPDGVYIGKSDVLIHGHTHRPAVHSTGHSSEHTLQGQRGLLSPGLRIVLPDWTHDHTPGDSPPAHRGGYLSLKATAQGEAQFDLVVWAH